MNLGQLPAFLDDALRIQRDSLQADGAIHDVADLAIDLAGLAACLGDVRRVGGDAVNNAPAPGFTDLGYVGSIKEQFHSR